MKQVTIDERQHEALRQRAKALHVSEDELVRRAIEVVLVEPPVVASPEAPDVRFVWTPLSDPVGPRGAEETLPQRHEHELVRVGHAGAVRESPEIEARFLGDIAWTGALSEYRDAATWLTRMAQAAEVRQDAIHVVPGNHDVGRKLIVMVSYDLHEGSAERQAKVAELIDAARALSDATVGADPPSVPPEDAALLLQINRGLPTEMRDRLRQLNDQCEAEALTPAEHAELLGLVAQVEALEVERIENLSRLARLRGVSLTALMDDLGIRPPDDG